MPTTPNASAAKNDLPGDLNATNHAAQASQFLGTHGIDVGYRGTQIVTPNGGNAFLWQLYGNAFDVDQPFAMPVGQTTVSRVEIPLNPYGNAADVLVSLWPDNGSGQPNTTGSPIASTMIPANWFSAISAPNGLPEGGPLATARFNTMTPFSGFIPSPWAPTSSGPNGVAGFPTVVCNSNYVILLGGFDTVSSSAVGNVSVATYQGPGSLSLPASMPAIPTPAFYGAGAAGDDFVVFVGGTNTSTAISNVWTAPWDGNNGIVSGWSAQTAYPSPITEAGAAVWSNVVYVVGGSTNETNATAQTTVNYASVSGGQISGWSVGPSLPIALNLPIVAAINGWLIVTGGLTTASTVNGQTFYAKINDDGSLGSWFLGPSMPVPIWPINPGGDVAITDSTLITVGGNITPAPSPTTTNAIQILEVGETGLGSWQTSKSFESTQEHVAIFDAGAGVWDMFVLRDTTSQYYYCQFVPMPLMSVPLNATGLTAGSTYHVVIQQHQGNNSANFLGIGIQNGQPIAFNALIRNRYSGAWTTIANTWSVPINVFNTDAVGSILNAVVDPDATNANVNSEIDLFVTNYLGVIHGYLSATAQPNGTLNSNPTFTTGTSPWTAANGTLTQSNAQTHGGFPFSGLLTPTGGFSTAFASSEIVPLVSVESAFNAARFLVANGWLYTPTTWPSVSLSVTWYDGSLNVISTSSNVQSLTGATWTNFINIFQAPATAAYAAVVPTLGGTPTAANTLFLSDVVLQLSPENTKMVSSVAQLTYVDDTWPPTGVVLL